MSTDMTTPDKTTPASEALGSAAAMARMPAREAAIAKAMSLRDVHAYYGETHAVRGVSLDYAANQVTAMIGPSGCGKSTLVRCINRMHEEIPGARADGEILLDDDVEAAECGGLELRHPLLKALARQAITRTCPSRTARCAGRSAW